MPSTFFGLSIGKTGLYASSAALNTTAHNASNATTEGYTRQKVTLRAGTPISVYSKAGMSGTGVSIISIERQRNIYYDEKYRTANSVYGGYNTKNYYLSAIENYFNETDSDSKGLTSTLSDFYKSLENLKDNPSESATRTAAKEAACNMTEYINHLGQSLQKVQEEANTDIKTTVQRINSIASQIATLNKQINTLELQGGAANDLRDQRDLILDELSQYCNISVNEVFVGDKTTSLNQFTVKVDGITLVDSYLYNTIEIETEEGSVNMNDVDNLYRFRWSTGEDFNSTSPSLGGKLQALFEVRDGNAGVNFNGKIDSVEKCDTDRAKIVVKQANCNNMAELNLPKTDGKITIGPNTFYYDSFSVNVETNGSYTYTFEGIKSEAGNAGSYLSFDDTRLAGKTGRTLSVGSQVDFKGVPYYQAQLNEFVRTYSKAFNELHNKGEDLNGDKGLDFFVGVDKVTGLDYKFSEKSDAGVSSGTTAKDNNETSYYHMTALNFSVNKDIQNNIMKICTFTKPDPNDGNVVTGVESTDLLDQLIKTQSDMSMFDQGKPSQFLETFTSNLGTDNQQAKLFADSQANICKSIEQQRMSVSSVDDDEEAISLVKYQNAYELSAKVVSTMQDMYDVLMGMI